MAAAGSLCRLRTLCYPEKWPKSVASGSEVAPLRSLDAALLSSPLRVQLVSLSASELQLELLLQVQQPF